MRYALRLGKIFGIPLYWHWSFLPVVAYLVYATLRGPGPVDWYRTGLMASLIVLLFGFILIHELGHALTARRFGQATEAIIFFPLGGGALIRGKPQARLREVLVYLAGPLSNLVLALLCFGLLLMLPEGRFFLRYYLLGGGNFSLPNQPLAHLLALSLLINLVLFGLNLLPAYPLDGGRILQAMLRPSLGRVGSTRVVAILGIVLATVLLWLGNRNGDWLMLGGAFFVGFLSLGALAGARQEARLNGKIVGDLLRPLPHNRVYLDMKGVEVRELPTPWRVAIVPVFDRWNDLQGFLPLDNAPDNELVSEAYDPAWVGLALNLPLDEALHHLMEANAYGGVVYDRGRVKGVLLMDDLVALLK